MTDLSEKDFILYSDEPLKKASILDFNAKEIVEKVSLIVASCPTPYHIGLFGPWGAGKTTILDSVESELNRNHSNAVKVVRLNAWKYRHDSLRRRFLITVAEKVNPDQQPALAQRLYSVAPGFASVSKWTWADMKRWTWWKARFRTLKVPVLISLVAIVAVMLVGFLQALAELGSCVWTLKGLGVWTQKSTSHLGTPLVVFVLTYVLNHIGRITVNDGENTLLSSQEQFEAHFSAALKALKEKERVIVIVDDLDRCSPTQVVEALETIKTFMNVEKCVFVVACARGLLEKALQTLEPQGNEAQSYLDKIFQLSIHLPPVLPANMFQYAEKLLRNLGGDNRSLVDEIISSRALEILIRPSVTTPRKVKRLLNDFLVRYSVALKREQEWEENERLTSDLPFLAKMTVLASEFPAFYEALSSDLDLMTWLEKIRLGQESDLESYQEATCAEYFKADEERNPDWSQPKAEYADLLFFLGQTWLYQGDTEKVRRHVFMSRDPEGAVIGDSFIRDVLVLAESAQLTLLEPKVSKASDPDAVIRLLGQHARTAQGNRKDNLLLALLKLSPLVSYNATGARLGASVLATSFDSEHFGTIAKGVDPSLVVPYLPMMNHTAGVAWLRLLRQWADEDRSSRGPLLVRKEFLKHWDRLDPGSFSELSDFVWTWLQEESGQNHFDKHLGDLAAHNHLKKIMIEAVFPKFLVWLGGGSQKRKALTDLQQKLLQSWVITCGAEEFLTRVPDTFWKMMHQMLVPRPSVLPDWVVGVLTEFQDRIPETWATEITLAAVDCVTEGNEYLWDAILPFAEYMLERFGSKAAGPPKRLMEALVYAFSSSHLPAAVSTVTKYWPLWSQEDHNIFHRELRDLITEDMEKDLFVSVTEWYRQTAAESTPTSREEYYAKVIELLNAYWQDSEWLALIREYLTNRRPFGLPDASKESLWETLDAISFHADKSDDRGAVLLLQSELAVELSSDNVPAMLGNTVRLYLSSGSSEERLRVACHVLAFHAAELADDERTAVNAIDLLSGRLTADEAVHEAAISTFHSIIRVVPWSVLESRQEKIEAALSSTHGGPASPNLLTLTSSVAHGFTLDYPSILLHLAEELHGDDDEETSHLAQWILEHQANVPIIELVTTAYAEQATHPLLTSLVDQGGDEIRGKVVDTLCEIIKESPSTRSNGMALLCDIGHGGHRPSASSISAMMLHFLTGSPTQAYFALEFLARVLPPPIPPSDERRIVRELLSLFTRTEDRKTRLAVVKTLSTMGLLKRKARSDIMSNLPSDEKDQEAIRKLL